MSILESFNAPQAKLISTNELAKIINYKSQTIRKWLCQDRLPEGFPRPTKIGSRNRWLLTDVNEYLAQLIRSSN